MIEKLPLNAAAVIWQDIVSSPVPFFQCAWHQAWFETEGRDYEPYLLLVNNTIIAPFARKDDHVIFSAQRFSDYSDVLGPEEEKASALKEILTYLKQDGVTALYLKNIPQNSSTVPFFQEYSFPFTITQQDTTPLLNLPNSFEEYLASLPKRSEIKRKLRRFEEENPSIEVKTSTDLAQDFPLLLELMKYNPEKEAYLTTPVVDFFNRLATLPQTKLVFLYVHGQVAAGRLYFEDREVVYGYNSGYIPTKYSGSGFYLLLQLIKQAITNKKTLYNFLRGAEYYKYELGAKDFPIFEVKGTL